MTAAGFDKPLNPLPFDHCGSFPKEMFWVRRRVEFAA